MLKYFLKELKIDVKFCKASELNFEGRKSELVLDMCKRLGADLYIFGALGRDYAETGSFSQNGIDIYFQDYSHPVYPQTDGKFISNLSVIDLLFNVGRNRALDTIMEGNITKEELKKRVTI